MAQVNKVALLESESKIHNTYFNDPTLSDLTIRLKDGTTLHAHRIVLCRGSAYFDSLITERIKKIERAPGELTTSEFNLQEIEFQDDNSHAMLALLRHIYGLPFNGHQQAMYRTQLKANAEVYAVGEKYQMRALQMRVYDNMQACVTPLATLELNVFGICDFIQALRTILTCNKKQDQYGRKLMVETSIMILPILRKEADFMQLLRDFVDLGAAIIGCEDFGSLLPGVLLCDGCVETQCDPYCPSCSHAYEEKSMWRHSRNEEWQCSSCSKIEIPICGKCGEQVIWARRNF